MSTVSKEGERGSGTRTGYVDTKVGERESKRARTAAIAARYFSPDRAQANGNVISRLGGRGGGNSGKRTRAGT